MSKRRYFRKALLFQRPVSRIICSDSPFAAKSDALPTLNEWVLYLEESSPHLFRHLIRVFSTR